jgi:hypothetical protein
MFPHDKPLDYQIRSLNGQWVVDVAKLIKHDTLLKPSDMCGIAILESTNQVDLPSLPRLLETSEPAPEPGRVPGRELPDMLESSDINQDHSRVDDLMDRLGDPNSELESESDIRTRTASEQLSDELRHDQTPRLPNIGDLQRIPMTDPDDRVSRLTQRPWQHSTSSASFRSFDSGQPESEARNSSVSREVSARSETSLPEPLAEHQIKGFKKLWEYRRTNTPRANNTHFTSVPVDDELFYFDGYSVAHWNDVFPVYRTHLLDPMGKEVFQVELNHQEDLLEVLRVEKELRPLTPAELQQYSQEVQEAMLKEIKSWVEHNTGTPIRIKDYSEQTGLRPIPSRWVIEFKMKEGKRVIKARLCLKGFAEMNQKSMQTFSPTASRTSLKLISFIAAMKVWEIWSLDISTAFLQGYSFDDLKENNIMKRQPCAFKVDNTTMKLFASVSEKFKKASNVSLWCIKLLKGAYGLKDAPLLWNLRIVAVLMDELGFIRSSHDGCVFYMVKHGELVLIISLHVDDTFITGLVRELKWLHTELEKRFGTVKCEKNDFKHFGIMVSRDPVGNISHDQRFYIDQLKPIAFDSVNGRRLLESPASAREKTDMRSLIGGISWVSMTSPVAQANASLLQHFGPDFNFSHLKAANAALEQLTTSYVPLVFRHGFRWEDLKILVVSDSSLGNVQDKYSQGAYWVMLCNDSKSSVCGLFALLGYNSARSKRVASSTFSAETLASMLGSEEALFLQTWLHEVRNPTLSARQLSSISGDKLIPIDICTDCKDLYEVLVKPATPNVTNKALVLYISALRHERELRRIRSVFWIDTRDMIANAFTKYESPGLLPLMEPDLVAALKRNQWEPRFPFERDGVKLYGKGK